MAAATSTTTVATKTVTPKLSELAAGAKADRNRAVDFYRAAAMLAVAGGHWMAIAIGTDADGELIAGNALEADPGMAWVTWLFQVMPLFFVVGGFSSAMSLDSHGASNGAPQDWVVARLRRMVAPTMVLATTWLSLLAVGGLVDITTGLGLTTYIAAGAVGAAIPLWFLSNYTIDTALAPYVLPRFRRSPAAMAVAGVTTFVALEALRFVEIGGFGGTIVGYLPHLNWVLGWLLFQVLGFAWRDGLLPTGRRMLVIAAGLWTLAIGAVVLGPWPLAMVHFPGLANSPTHPPSLALMLFGAAYSTTAIAFAPAISRFFTANQRAWASVVAANSVAMSVYLWHMTAAAAAGAAFFALGWLPTATVGTAAWWLQKAPLLVAAALLLAAIVSKVAKVEQQALLAPRRGWDGSEASMLVAAALLSASVKIWSSPDIALAAAGMVALVGLWFGKIRGVRFPQRADLQTTP